MRPPSSPKPTASIPAELERYREMLEPLSRVPADGSRGLAADEQPAWDAALGTLRSYHGDHLELEEAVAAFARALWSAPGWSEPPARIAEALATRVKHWPEAEREPALALARTFAERALSLDQTSVPARVALTRVFLLSGNADEAEKTAGVLPSAHGPSLAARSEVAEARGNLDRAIALRLEQLAVEKEPAAAREARNRLGLLYQAAGRLDEAISTHRDNLARHPEFAWGKVNLGSALEARGEVLQAFAEVEGAVGLGVAEASPFLDELGATLDRDALERFRRLLRTSRDGDECTFLPTPFEDRAEPEAHP